MVFSSVVLLLPCCPTEGFPCGSAGKKSTCNARDLDLIPGLGRSPGEGMATHSKFWPGEFHGLYHPWGCKESDMTWVTFTFTCPTEKASWLDYAHPSSLHVLQFISLWEIFIFLYHISDCITLLIKWVLVHLLPQFLRVLHIPLHQITWRVC